MDTTYLKTFQKVIETGSFSTAARELGYAQSTVTGHVRVLERQMGRRLIDRQPSGAVPTEAGARVLRHAESLLRHEHQMLREVRQPPRRSIALRLAAPESLSAYRLPPVLATLARSERPVHVSVTMAGTAGSLAAVRRGAVEAALVIEPNLSAEDLVKVKLGAEPVQVLTSRSEATTDQPIYLLPEPGCCYGDDLADQLTIDGTSSSRIIRMDSVETLKRCCVAGMGRTILPSFAVQEELARGDLLALDSVTVRPPCAYLVWHAAVGESPLLTRVAEVLSSSWHHATARRTGFDMDSKTTGLPA